MTVSKILAIIADNPLWIAIIAILVPSLIEITPIKINPWKALFKKIGMCINGNLESKISILSKEVDDLREETRKDEAVSRRARIIRFGDEIRLGMRHSEEHFRQILEDVDFYEQYCSDNPSFRNNVAIMTIDLIKSTYKERLVKNDFL